MKFEARSTANAVALALFGAVLAGSRVAGAQTAEPLAAAVRGRRIRAIKRLLREPQLSLLLSGTVSTARTHCESR